MNPGRYNITVYKGTTFTLAPVWKIDNLPVNITGYTAAMSVKPDTDSASIVDLTTANGRAVISGALGQTTFTLTATETNTLTAGTYVYDFNLTNPSDGSVYKILQGSFVINASVTA